MYSNPTILSLNAKKTGGDYRLFQTSSRSPADGVRAERAKKRDRGEAPLAVKAEGFNLKNSHRHRPSSNVRPHQTHDRGFCRVFLAPTGSIKLSPSSVDFFYTKSTQQTGEKKKIL